LPLLCCCSWHGCVMRYIRCREMLYRVAITIVDCLCKTWTLSCTISKALDCTARVGRMVITTLRCGRDDNLFPGRLATPKSARCLISTNQGYHRFLFA
jgi:hypothetical protein